MWHENDRASEAMVCTLIEGRHTETRHENNRIGMDEFIYSQLHLSGNDICTTVCPFERCDY